jgi:hypothetical protein
MTFTLEPAAIGTETMINNRLSVFNPLVLIFLILAACKEQTISNYIEIPFVLENNRIIVEAIVNNTKGRFVFDTGTTESYLDIKATNFYNFFKDERFVLGPIGSINAINNIFTDFFELHTGITFSIRNFFDYDFYKNSIFGFTFLTVEAGYRYNNKGANGFYASISMDLISALYGYLAGEKKDEAEIYQKEHPLY